MLYVLFSCAWFKSATEGDALKGLNYSFSGKNVFYNPTSTDAPSTIKDRYPASSECTDDLDFQYIARQGTDYNRVDVLCVEEQYKNFIHVDVKESPRPAYCEENTCGFATSFKGYPIEPSILRSIASFTRNFEVKKENDRLLFQESTNQDNIEVHLDVSSSLNRFSLNAETKCASILKSKTIDLKDPLFRKKYIDVDYKKFRDHTSSRSILMQHSKKTDNPHKLIANFVSSFTHQNNTLGLEETITCQNEKEPVDLYNSGFVIAVVPYSYHLWAVYTYSKP